MTIYRLGNDFAYTDLTIKTKEDVRRFMNYKGQPIIEEWNTDVFALSNDRLQKGKSDSFNARCYGSMLVVSSYYQPKLDLLLPSRLQCLPVKIDGVKGEFIFVNILGTLPAINFDGLNFNQSMQMMRGNEFRFHEHVTAGQILFRDMKVNSCFCSDVFVNFCHLEGMVGLKFDEAGPMR